MKKGRYIAYGFLTLILGLGLFWALKADPTHSKPAITTLRTLPGFKLPGPGGTLFSNSDLKGRRVLLHFWAAWCPPCLPEIPEIVAFARRHPEILVIAVSADPNRESLEKVLPSGDLPENLRSLLDVEAKLPEALGSFQYPETYLVNERGEIEFKWVGAQDWESQKI